VSPGVAVRTASALSEHPLATHAVGECVGHLLDVGAGDEPDLVVLFVTEPHVGGLEDITRAVRQLMSPRSLLGASAVSVLAGRREVEEHAAIAMFALWSMPSNPTARPRPVRIEVTPRYDGPELGDLEQLRDATGTLLVLADPFTCPVDRLLAEVAEVAPQLVVVGGLASSARLPGGNRLALDGALHADGAVAVLVPPSVPVTAVVSQGCRPIGRPLTVTKAERNVLHELAGRPALELLVELLQELSPEEQQLASQGLHVGRVIDEYQPDFGRGDFLIRAVLGGDREAGAVAVGDEIEVGSTIQFQVRDAATATEDLDELLAGRRAQGALVFTCNGRGSRLFGVPDHDADAVSEALADAPIAGMFCAGELGPVGARNFAHGFTASVALFG
jgi:small ligand-binding sensory domain FIST